MNTSRILSELRDIHEPLPPEASLPWLLLANLLVLGIIVALLLYRRGRRHRSWRNTALAAIRQASRLPPSDARMTLAVTLRRVMLHLEGAQINALSGDAWLHRLDTRFNTDWFTTEGSRLFGDALYSPCTLSAGELDGLCRRLSDLVRALPVDARREATRSDTATATTSTSTS